MASGSQAGNAAEIDRHALVLAKDPGSKAFIPLAEEYGKAGMWAEAAGVLEDGLKYYPGFITAMVALGRAYDQMGQPTKAKAILEEAVKISPENLRAHRTLAKIYVAEGAKEAALRSCHVILAANSFDQEALSLRASLGAPEILSKKSKAGLPVQPKTEKMVAVIPSPVPESVSVEVSPAALNDTVKDPSQPVLNETKAASADPATSEKPNAEPVANADGHTAPILLAEVDSIVDHALHRHVTATPEPPSTAEHAPQPARHQATVQKLEQWLGTIQARRRDRPSAKTTVPTSHD